MSLRRTASIAVLWLLFGAFTADRQRDAAVGAADRPAPRTDDNSMRAHAQLLEKKRRGRIDVYFEGDSIVRRWGALDYPELLANWNAVKRVQKTAARAPVENQ